MDQAYQASFEYVQNGIALVKQKCLKGTIHKFGWHNTVELIVILSGEVEIFANGQAYLQKEDDVLILGANCGHALYPKTGDCMVFTTEILPELIAEQDLPIFKGGAISSNDLPDAPLLWVMIRQQLAKLTNYITLIDAQGESNKLAEGAIRAAVTTIFSDLYLRCGQRLDEYLSPPDSCARNEAVLKVIDHIKKNYREKISLDQAAEIAGYNKTYLASLFKRQIGISLYEYLIRTRIRHAMELLSDARNSATDIALACGFADSYSFATYTKKYCGCLPQEYQKLFSIERPRVALVGAQELVESRMARYLRLQDNAQLNKAMEELQQLVDRYT